MRGGYTTHSGGGTSGRIGGSVVFLFLATAGGCAPARDGTEGLVRAERSVGTAQKVGPDSPPVTIGDTALTWEELRPFLAEAAGGVVVEEMILDSQVRAELGRRGLEVSEAEIVAEHELLAAGLRRGTSAGEEEASRLMTRLQQARGLGPTRFRALLERNAMLRRLVRDGIEIDRAAVERDLKVRYGERVKCRIIVVPSESDAARVMARLGGPEDTLAERFAGEARLLSVDPSASRGGDVEPISSEDVSYAVAVRNAVKELGAGALSPIIVLDRGYAILLGEGKVESTTPPEGAREAAEAEMRVRQERVAMDRLGQRLLNSAPVTVFDPSLSWSWKTRMLKSAP